MRSRSFPAASLAILMTAAAVNSANADEAYVCDQGRIVYVKPGQLEHLKRTDPCIAGYYGLTVGEGAGAAPTVKAATSSELVEELVLGAEKGLKLERDAMNAGTPASLATPDGRDKPQPAAFVVKKPAAPAAAKPVLKAAPADFRNVVIINAAPGAATVYRHEK